MADTPTPELQTSTKEKGKGKGKKGGPPSPPPVGASRPGKGAGKSTVGYGSPATANGSSFQSLCSIKLRPTETWVRRRDGTVFKEMRSDQGFESQDLQMAAEVPQYVKDQEAGISRLEPKIFDESLNRWQSDNVCKGMQEIVTGHKITGMLSKDGAWYEGPLSNGMKPHGSIRVRLHDGKVISNFRSQDKTDWSKDTIATSEEISDLPELGRFGPLRGSIKGYTWQESASSVNIVINLDEHLYTGAADEITMPTQVKHRIGKENLKLSVWHDAEEVWTLDLYPLAGQVCPEKATLDIDSGKIFLQLPKAAVGETWGRMIGDVCKSWRDIGTRKVAPLNGGLVDCAQRCMNKKTSVEQEELSRLTQRILHGLDKRSLQVGWHVPELNDFSIFQNVSVCDKQHVLGLAFQDPLGNRSIGAMIGMAIADTVGSQLEFLPVGSKGHYFNLETLSHVGALNKFRLEAGQWTDDTSMSLCLADSLLTCGKYDGSDIRVRFWNWWNCGYNNAFRLDEGRSDSVGLGGNIGKSLHDVKDAKPPPRFESGGSEDSGNGSLMRLAPVPIFFHKDIELAVRVSAESSLTTHPGSIAADACGFLGFLIVRAIRRPAGCDKSAAAFLDECCLAYLQRLAADEQPILKRLLIGREPAGSTERCWNWRDPDGPFLSETLSARGHCYNGYPVDSGYFGSYCMDGLAVALHCVYQTVSFSEAITRCVNCLGDADSTGAICGQIAGAFYGVSAIDQRLIGAVETWDSGEIALRAVLLYGIGVKLSKEAAAFEEPEMTLARKSVCQRRKRSRSRSRQRCSQAMPESCHDENSWLVSKGSLRLVTYNVWFSKQRQRARSAALFSILKGSEADVICLQEVTPEFLNWLRDEGWVRSKYALSDSIGTTLKGSQLVYGVIMLWRREFSVASLNLYVLPTSMNRSALVVAFRILRHELRVVTVHLESLDNARIRSGQLERIFQIVWRPSFRYDHCAGEDRNGHGVDSSEHFSSSDQDLSDSYGAAILAGDMNFDEGAGEEQIPSKAGFSDCWHSLKHLCSESDVAENGITMPADDHSGRPTRIDRIFLGPSADNGASWKLLPQSMRRLGLEPLGDEPDEEALTANMQQADKDILISTPADLRPSDHFGLCCDFQLVSVQDAKLCTLENS